MENSGEIVRIRAGQQTGDNSIYKQAATSSLWEILSEEAVANQAALIASDEIVSAWSISDWERYSQERASKLRRRSSEAHSFEQERLRDADVKSDPMKAFTLKWEAEKMFWKDYPPYPTMFDICAITKLSEDSAKQPSMLELAAALAEADRVAFGATSAKEVLTARRILRITLAAVLDHKTYLEDEPEKNQKSNGSLSETYSRWVIIPQRRGGAEEMWGFETVDAPGYAIHEGGFPEVEKVAQLQSRQPRCSSVTDHCGYAPSSRLVGGAPAGNAMHNDL